MKKTWANPTIEIRLSFFSSSKFTHTVEVILMRVKTVESIYLIFIEFSRRFKPNHLILFGFSKFKCSGQKKIKVYTVYKSRVRFSYFALRQKFIFWSKIEILEVIPIVKLIGKSCQWIPNIKMSD